MHSKLHIWQTEEAINNSVWDKIYTALIIEACKKCSICYVHCLN